MQNTTGAIEGCRVALGPAIILNYLLQVGHWVASQSLCVSRVGSTVLRAGGYWAGLCMGRHLPCASAPSALTGMRTNL